MSDVLDKGSTRDRPAAFARKRDRRQLYGGYFKREVPSEDAELALLKPFLRRMAVAEFRTTSTSSSSRINLSA